MATPEGEFKIRDERDEGKVALPKPGWYRHEGEKRYWDGEKLTADVWERDPLVIPGFVTAILFPIVGFIIGIVLLTRNAVSEGWRVLVLSVIGAAVWAAILTEADRSSAAVVRLLGA